MSDQLESAVIDAVKAAMDSGKTVKDLLGECLHQWTEELRERLSTAEHTTIELKRK